MDTQEQSTEQQQVATPDPKEIFESSIANVIKKRARRNPSLRYKRNNIDVLLSMGVDTYEKLQAEVMLIDSKVSDRSSQERAILSGVYFLVNRRAI